MSSMRVDSAPLIANSLIVGDSGMGVAGINIPSTGEDGPSVLYQYVTLPADNETEFRMLVTSQPGTGTLTTFEDGSFIYDAPQSTTDSFAYEWFKGGVSQGVDIVNLQIGGDPGQSVNISITENFDGFNESIEMFIGETPPVTIDITETFDGFVENININIAKELTFNAKNIIRVKRTNNTVRVR